MSDPKLSLCSSATRGIWIDFLCVMHMNDRCGVITGTREQLARLGRCSTVEVSTAISELDQTATADVTERNGVVTLICRRMKRESEARKQGRLRVKKHRENEPVTLPETQNPLLEYSSGSEILPEKEEGAGGGSGSLEQRREGGSVQEKPTLERVLTYCRMSAGIADDCGTAFFNQMDAVDWVDRAQRPVKKWEPLLRNFAMNWRANQSKEKAANPSRGRPQTTLPPATLTGKLLKI